MKLHETRPSRKNEHPKQITIISDFFPHSPFRSLECTWNDMRLFFKEAGFHYNMVQKMDIVLKSLTNCESNFYMYN